ncbi:hypothetical protein [Bacillus benzoevorans]|uniref:Preprotein translocase subunit YajC n=1 Tax=Bacillus benzoevorans TaxID=1456 RepID=A0A7X0HVX4_9BACI|nr:hypothetical protein [Bacillus benzoevorans]MBB6447848.1 preprotein translocase subunit YajC [Bacillus benzoevorans]
METNLLITLLTSIIPFLYFIVIIAIIWWMVAIKRTNQKQVEQNNEIIELLKRLIEKENDKHQS